MTTTFKTAMPPMSDSEMKTFDDVVLERLAACEGVHPTTGEIEIGAIFVEAFPLKRVEQAYALNIDPMLADELHSSLVRHEQNGLVEKVLIGQHVTHVKYRRVSD